MIFAQMVINVGMCLSILPVVGITLPFFSAGGTSISIVMGAVGVLLNISRAAEPI